MESSNCEIFFVS